MGVGGVGVMTSSKKNWNFFFKVLFFHNSYKNEVKKYLFATLKKIPQVHIGPQDHIAHILEHIGPHRSHIGPHRTT